MRVFRPQNAQVARFWRMALREIVGHIVEGILGIITSVASFIVLLATKEHRAIHDMVAGTVVIQDPDNVLGRSLAGQAPSPDGATA